MLLTAVKCHLLIPFIALGNFCLSISTSRQVDKILCILPTSRLPRMSFNLCPVRCNTTFNRIPWPCSRISRARAGGSGYLWQVAVLINAEPSSANGTPWRIEVGVCMSGLRRRIMLPLLEPACHLFLVLQTAKIQLCQCTSYAYPWVKDSTAQGARLALCDRGKHTMRNHDRSPNSGFWLRIASYSVGHRARHDFALDGEDRRDRGEIQCLLLFRI